MAVHAGAVSGYRQDMTSSDPTDAQSDAQGSDQADAPAPKQELPFDKEDLTFGPDDVVQNSDADGDVESDPAKDDETGSDWTDEGGATDDGPATDTDAAGSGD